MVKTSWQQIAVELSQYDEATLDRMLNDEITTHKRPAIAKRLHQRLCLQPPPLPKLQLPLRFKLLRQPPR